MPWRKKTVEKQREDFVAEVQLGEESKSSLCRKYGISRPTGDKWISRSRNEESYEDRSRVPFHMPNKTAKETEEKILAAREKHPAWGARKLHRVLANNGETKLPAISTVNDILKRNGYISKEASLAATPYKRFEKETPNEMWQADFKGHFAMENGERCYPLTVLDDHSRYSLCIDAKENEQGKGVRESFVRLFETYGLPNALLCDNGNPWGSSQSTGYTKFEIWLMGLGILPIHGRPLHPQTQGKEERFHRTLNVELLKTNRIVDVHDAQRQFNLFRYIYNNERPHEALDMETPAQHYHESLRRFSPRVEPWEYPDGYDVRKVKSTGYITYRNQGYYLSESFGGMEIGIRESYSSSHCINLYYRNFKIAEINIDERTFLSRKIYRAEGERPHP